MSFLRADVMKSELRTATWERMAPEYPTAGFADILVPAHPDFRTSWTEFGGEAFRCYTEKVVWAACVHSGQLLCPLPNRQAGFTDVENVRGRPWRPRGTGIIAHQPRPDSSVVERGPEKAGVGGSIPSLATTF
jgi:hypothetical protein